MHVLKYNKYTHRYYSYDLEDVDTSSDMFNIDLHDNDIDFERPLPRKKCMYCHTIFKSRNELFYHLGFMNIDIGRRRRRKIKKYKNEFIMMRFYKRQNPIDELDNLMKKKLRLSS